MRFTSFVLLSLGLVASIAFSAPQDPPTCYASEAPAYPKTREAMLCVKNGLLYLAGALINSNPTHDELIDAARYQFDQCENLRKEAQKANVEDPKFLRRAYFSSKISTVNNKIRVGHAMIYVGVPSFPFLGKAINWVRKEWEIVKAKWNKLFHKKKPEGSGSSSTESDGVEDLDEETVHQAQDLTGRLTDTVADLEDAIGEMETKSVC